MKRGEGSSKSRVGLSSTRHAVRVQQKGFQSIVVVVCFEFAMVFAKGGVVLFASAGALCGAWDFAARLWSGFKLLWRKWE